MFINPQTAIEQNWIRHRHCQSLSDWTDRKFISPAAIDFTLDDLRTLSNDPAHVSETSKTMRSTYETQKSPQGWMLQHGNVYDGTSNMYVELPKGVGAILYTRSTLARNGVFLVSGFYDPGYKGHIGYTIYPIGGGITIQPGTRVGQIAFINADSKETYAGGWNHHQGTHYTTR